MLEKYYADKPNTPSKPKYVDMNKDTKHSVSPPPKFRSYEPLQLP